MASGAVGERLMVWTTLTCTRADAHCSRAHITVHSGRFFVAESSERARRRRERRMRSWFRHEQQSVRMALVTVLHHSYDRVHTEYAAPRSQNTATRARRGRVIREMQVP